MSHINKSHKQNTIVVLAILSLCMMTLTAHAAEAETIGTVVYDGDIYIYVRGVSAIQPDSVIQIGNTVCPAEQISTASFNDLENCIRTLILVDNSKSVPEKNHADIQEILHQFAAESMSNEQIRIGTFSQDITYLCEYTNNQETLDGVIDGITYNDQDTYLGYALYTAVSQIKEEQTPLCKKSGHISRKQGFWYILSAYRQKRIPRNWRQCFHFPGRPRRILFFWMEVFPMKRLFTHSRWTQ